MAHLKLLTGSVRKAVSYANVRVTVAAGILVALLSLPAGAAGAPANDNFADATEISGFPVSATQTGSGTSEPGEPAHAVGGGGSVWYRWTAPADGPTVLRLCGDYGGVAVYTGERVDALTLVIAGRARARRCGGSNYVYGATVTFTAIRGEVYRVAVSSSSFQLLLGNQAAVVTGLAADASAMLFSYRALPGQADKVKLRLSGPRTQRALLLEARGLTAANGCYADLTPGLLRCPVPGAAQVVLDIDLGDGNDTADIRLPGRDVPSDEHWLQSPSLLGHGVGMQTLSRRVLGGEGNDRLAGSAGYYSLESGWEGALALLGGPGADRFAGGAGDDWIFGGLGPDRIVGGGGHDFLAGGAGNDRVRSVDDAIDDISCQAGADGARVDGIDLAQGCERRELRGPARAVPISAALEQPDEERPEYLEIAIACPVDTKGGCETRIAATLSGRGIIRRHIRVPAGDVNVIAVHDLEDVNYRRLLITRGLLVTVSTGRPGGGTLKFTRLLPVENNLYDGN
jgi:RTX calcium-binding nonapeptide repeat (4 copies)